MFLRKETVDQPTGVKYCVPYCQDCHSQEIETIQTCKKCGSHHIKSGFDLLDDNEYGIKVETKKVTKHIYKCDVCGKEFDGDKISDYISYFDGEFNNDRYESYYDYESSVDSDAINYQLDKDLCGDCKSRLVTMLSTKLFNFTRNENISNLIDEYYKDKSEE